METWIRIENTNYFVSSYGRIKTSEDNIRHQYSCRGYMYVNLCILGKWKPYQVHRLVAKCFIANPNNKPQVDHINSNPSDNRVKNLRWVTPKENQNNEISKNKHKKKVICINTGKIYNSIMECAQNYNIAKSSVSMVLTKKRKSCFGLCFDYVK